MMYRAECPSSIAGKCDTARQEACGVFQSRLYVVDLQTGGYLAELVIPGADAAPLVGTPVIYRSGAGYLASRAFVGDAKGRLFRIDTQAQDPTKWKVELFYDIGVASPVMAPPAVVVDSGGGLSIVYGTGDTDNLELKLVVNRVVSLRERVTVDANSGKIVSASAVPNFRIDLNQKPGGKTSETATGEKLTGNMVVFDSVLHFSTFVPSEKG